MKLDSYRNFYDLTEEGAEITCLFLKPGICQSPLFCLCTETRVLFFEETCYFWDNAL